jgi:hypothetical protein
LVFQPTKVKKLKGAPAFFHVDGMIQNENAASNQYMPILQANDGSTAFVTIEQLAGCNVLHCMSDNEQNGGIIPLENVDGRLLDWLCRFLSCDDECAKIALVEQHERPLELVHLANYLDIPNLQQHASMRVADVIRRQCTTESDMRRLFGDVPDVRTISLTDDAYGESFTVLMAQVERACVTPIAH